MKYQIREYVCGKRTAFEVWQCTPEKTFFRTHYRWELLTSLPTFETAEAYVSKKAGGYYKSRHDYDAAGAPIIHAW